MLNSEGHEDVCYCVCDPEKMDMPIVFASDGFAKFTGFSHNEIEGRNCRFLQGPDTAPADVARIRKAIKDEVELSVNLLNYRKNGTKVGYLDYFLYPTVNVSTAKGPIFSFVSVLFITTLN
jgi:PAS domain-containing protein